MTRYTEVRLREYLRVLRNSDTGHKLGRAFTAGVEAAIAILDGKQVANPDDVYDDVLWRDTDEDDEPIESPYEAGEDDRK